jgi:hypothetical protein
MTRAVLWGVHPPALVHVQVVKRGWFSADGPTLWAWATAARAAAATKREAEDISKEDKEDGSQVAEGVSAPDKFYFPLTINTQCIICTLQQFPSRRNMHLWRSVEAIVGRRVGVEGPRILYRPDAKRHGAAECAERVLGHVGRLRGHRRLDLGKSRGERLPTLHFRDAL